MFEILEQFFMMMATNYGVDPVVLTTIHFSSTPVMLGALAWLVRNGRTGRNIGAPLVLAVFSYLSSYIYLAIYGHDLPVWVWGVAATIITVFGFGTIRRTRLKIAA